MIGGKVIEVCNVPHRSNVLFVNVAERPYKRTDTCGVLVENNETSQKIEIGDSLWWQCGYCYWTPQNSERKKENVDFDIKIPKRSGSGVTFESVSKSVE